MILTSQFSSLFSLSSIVKGSLPSDFDGNPQLEHPFKPCPDSPNCVIHSVEFNLDAKTLFSAASTVLEEMNPYKLNADSHSLQIEAVFRIPVFRFKDDLEIVIDSKPSGSIFHIRSASRVGHSDLGVNRRRVHRILNGIKNNL
ncbi:MAG: DUF1499 domain-containing protein [Balneolaceae bacterium]|nr:MAG: DUF1499 domain-containing protein [Balneolaceae bacterium]